MATIWFHFFQRNHCQNVLFRNFSSHQRFYPFCLIILCDWNITIFDWKHLRHNLFSKFNVFNTLQVLVELCLHSVARWSFQKRLLCMILIAKLEENLTQDGKSRKFKIVPLQWLCKNFRADIQISLLAVLAVITVFLIKASSLPFLMSINRNFLHLHLINNILIAWIVEIKVSLR